MPRELGQLPKLYSEQEIAAYLGLKAATLGNKRRAGEISAVRTGRGYSYTIEQITAYLEARKRHVTPKKPSASGATGSPGGAKPQPGIGRSTTPPLDGPAVKTSVQRIMERPTKPSKRGC